MALALQDFASLVRTQAAAVTASARSLVDVSVGSVLRAVLEANASVALWVQWLIVEVLATTRAATSRGADLDTWMADFGLARLPAVAATGVVTFARATPGFAAVIPAGALLRGGDVLFRVAADPGHPAWTGAGYALAAAASEIDVPIIAAAPGFAGNVRAGEVRLIASAIPGVDSVSNALGCTGGLDAEADDALRARFGGFLDSRTRATPDAVAFAVRSVQQGLGFRVMDRVDTAGAVRAGFFTVVVHDGFGLASPALLAAVGAAVEAVRPAGCGYAVRPPAVLRPAVSMRVDGSAAARDAVRAAIGAWIGGRAIGETLVLSRLTQVAHDAHPAVLSVGSVTIGGAAADFAPPPFGLLRPGVIEVLPS